MIDNKIFWAEDFYGEKAKGGIFVRAVDLKKFLELVEANENGNGGDLPNKASKQPRIVRLQDHYS